MILLFRLKNFDQCLLSYSDLPSWIIVFSGWTTFSLPINLLYSISFALQLNYNKIIAFITITLPFLFFPLIYLFYILSFILTFLHTPIYFPFPTLSPLISLFPFFFLIILNSLSIPIVFSILILYLISLSSSTFPFLSLSHYSSLLLISISFL